MVSTSNNEILTPENFPPWKDFQEAWRGVDLSDRAVKTKFHQEQDALGQKLLTEWVKRLRTRGLTYREITLETGLKLTRVYRLCNNLTRGHKGSYITQNGERIFQYKRVLPEKCEICSGASKKLKWHHWNSEHLEWGVWVCGWCHSGIEFFEHGGEEKVAKYLELKEKYGRDYAEVTNTIRPGI